MPYPNPGLAIEAGHEERVVSGYIAQLYARKQLNQMHSVLYKPNVPVNENVLDALSQTLDTKKWLPDQFRFDPENDKPANNLLEARLRAKFWGAQVIIHRPIIRKVLEMPLNEVPNYLNETRVTWIKKAIRGLVESTRAFHGLGMGRLIVTNIFGTATA